MDIVDQIRGAGRGGIIFPNFQSTTGLNEPIILRFAFGTLHDCGDFRCPHNEQLTPIAGEYDFEGFAHVYEEESDGNSS